MMIDHHEQRRFTRRPFTVDVLLKSGKTVTSGTTHDISLKGLYLSVPTEGQLPVHKRVHVTLQLQNAGSLRVKLRGRITRRDAEGVGIEFDSMNFDTFMQLKQIVGLLIGDQDEVVSEFVDYVTKKQDE
jgi:hypothetical protein